MITVGNAVARALSAKGHLYIELKARYLQITHAGLKLATISKWLLALNVRTTLVRYRYTNVSIKKEGQIAMKKSGRLFIVGLPH